MIKMNVLVLILALLSCNSINPPSENKILEDAQDTDQGVKSLLSRIQLPEGFKIEIYAEDVKNARSMALSPKWNSICWNSWRRYSLCPQGYQ